MTEVGQCCFYCGNPMAQPTETRCCSEKCEQLALGVERTSMDELLDDRLAQVKFLRPLNPDPVTAIAKELKRGI